MIFLSPFCLVTEMHFILFLYCSKIFDVDVHNSFSCRVSATETCVIKCSVAFYTDTLFFLPQEHLLKQAAHCLPCIFLHKDQLEIMQKEVRSHDKPKECLCRRLASVALTRTQYENHSLIIVLMH